MSHKTVDDVKFMPQEQIINDIDHIFMSGLYKFKEACNMHIPCGISSGSLDYIKYIPEQCFLTYISWALINSGYILFNEQEVDVANHIKRTQHFDLIARCYPVEDTPKIQLKIEAKGNLDNGYKQILADIERMERYALPDINFASKGLHMNISEKDFHHRFNCVITQNWGLSTLSQWWIDENMDAPKGRTAADWSVLKEKLLMARKRKKITILKSSNGWEIDALYAIFSCAT